MKRDRSASRTRSRSRSLGKLFGNSPIGSVEEERYYLHPNRLSKYSHRHAPYYANVERRIMDEHNGTYGEYIDKMNVVDDIIQEDRSNLRHQLSLRVDPRNFYSEQEMRELNLGAKKKNSPRIKNSRKKKNKKSKSKSKVGGRKRRVTKKR